MKALETAHRAPTAVLAEDEPLLADELAELLRTLWPQLQIVARAADGVAALHAIEEHQPDLVFLDIQMPLLTGLEVARRIAGACHVVFITSYDSHALEAFEAGAIDYVLKPPSADRLLTTLRRVQERLLQPAADLRGALSRVGAAPSLPRPFLQWINASRGAAVRLITVEEILYFKSDQKFTLVVTADSEALIRKTIRELGDELDPAMFWQVHRSTIVNLYAIDSVIRDERGNLSLRLKNRAESLAVSEAHTHLFRQM
ncbi:LytTR family DNA-binding domain-containing protein [Ramlibacter sp. PS3R-8]|uniref:LytR/AlgR family response regulator transcription factor n=1 Tax=Ramlibacter sp. PS3R-8 TaxID=3133437 RepID=UPI003096BDC8